CDRELFLELGGFSERLQLGEDLDFLRRLRDVRGREAVGHIRESFILTSARRLRRLPFHLAMPGMFARWVLAFAGIWRTRPY
ncbi:MAG: glycosyltransferase family 2 protein, partial [Chloroflexota bacterium]